MIGTKVAFKYLVYARMHILKIQTWSLCLCTHAYTKNTDLVTLSMRACIFQYTENTNLITPHHTFNSSYLRHTRSNACGYGVGMYVHTRSWQLQCAIFLSRSGSELYGTLIRIKPTMREVSRLASGGDILVRK